MKLHLRHTEVELSYTLLCLTAAAVLLGVTERFVWCALAIMIHESGHLLAMRRCGYFPKRIKISLFAIDITDSARQERTAAQNAFIIFFGPFANFVCFLCGYLLYLKGIVRSLPFAAANLSVGLFNSLPVLSLDGGQLLWLLLCRRCMPASAEKVVNALTFACIFPLAALGFWLLLRERNVSLLFVSIYLTAALLNRENRFF